LWSPWRWCCIHFLMTNIGCHYWWFSMFNSLSSNCLDIFYRNARGLFYQTVGILWKCLLRGLQNCMFIWNMVKWRIMITVFFPCLHTVYRSDRWCANRMCGGGVFIAVSHEVRSFKRRCDLEFFEEYVWVEIPTRGGFKL
jgi:hypothetical protein